MMSGVWSGSFILVRDVVMWLMICLIVGDCRGVIDW